MTTLPAASWVQVPTKAAAPVSLAEPLALFVANEYNSDPAALKDAVRELAELRDACVVRPPEKHESGYNALAKYYGQLLSLMRRFPFASLEPWNGVLPMPIKVKFAWPDLFASGMFAKKTVELVDINFERINVLFNLAALQSQIGALANSTSDDGLKIATKNFQGAAIFFHAVANLVHKHYTTPPTTDLTPSLLHAFSQIMLAQAQECIWRKCILERKSDAIVAKLARQAASFYEEAARTLATRPEIDKNWIGCCQSKMSYFEAEAQFKQGVVDLEQKHYGLSVGRFHIARALIKKAVEYNHNLASQYKFDCKPLTHAIEEKCNKAERDNSMIYLEVVPKPESIPVVERHALVSADKPLPDFTAPDVMGKDLFQSVVPLEVHKAAQRYNDRRDAEIREIIDSLRKATADSVDALLAMGLPAAIQATENPDTVPQDLLAKCEEIRASGGVRAMEEKISNLPSLSKTCIDMLDDASNSLDEEEQQDAEYRRKHGSNWKREKSETIAKPTRTEIDKYRTIINNAAAADRQVVSKFDAIKPAVILMSKSPAELQAALPSSAHTQGGNASALGQLKAILSELDALRVERDGLEPKLETAKEKDDVLPLLLEKGSAAPEESVFEEQMLVYKPLKDAATAAIRKTEDAMARCKEAHGRFSSGRGAGSEREQMLTDLQAKYEGWKELNKHLNDGGQFYTRLSGMLSQLQVKVKDFCLARQLESTDLLQSIPRTIAATPAEEYRAPEPAAPPRPPTEPAPVRQSSGPTSTSPYAAIPSYGVAPGYPMPPSQHGYGAPPAGAYGAAGSYGAPPPQWGAGPSAPYGAPAPGYGAGGPYYGQPGPYGYPQHQQPPPHGYQPYGGPYGGQG